MPFFIEQAATAALKLGRIDEAVLRLDTLLAVTPEDGSLLLERQQAAQQLSCLRADAANELFRAGEVRGPPY